MVTFRLVEETEDYLVYWYFPDGHEDEKYGIILINKLNKTIQIQKLADKDFSYIVTSEEQNQFRESVNAMRKEDGLPPLSKQECPYTKTEFTKTFFADHAIKKIIKSYKSGKILHEGISAWY